MTAPFGDALYGSANDGDKLCFNYKYWIPVYTTIHPMNVRSKKTWIRDFEMIAVAVIMH